MYECVDVYIHICRKKIVSAHFSNKLCGGRPHGSKYIGVQAVKCTYIYIFLSQLTRPLEPLGYTYTE